MPRLSKDNAPNVQDAGPAIDRNGDLDDTTVNFVTIRESHSLAQLLRGLPGDAASARTGGTCSPGRSPSATPTARKPTRPATPST